VAAATLWSVGAAGAFAAEQQGNVEGHVRLEGRVPATRPASPVTVDVATCGASVPDESVIVDPGGGVRNAVVLIAGESIEGAGTTEAVVDNLGCRFVPRVQVVARGQRVRVQNTDPVLHNTRAVLVNGAETVLANLALSRAGQSLDLTRRLTGRLPPAGTALVRLGCDVHPWMTGWLVVSDEPHAVTGPYGAFRITGVPAGEHRVSVWHERLGRAQGRVRVEPGGTARAELSLSGVP